MLVLQKHIASASHANSSLNEKMQIHPAMALALLFAICCLAYGFQLEYLARDDLFFKHSDNSVLSLAIANYGNGRFLPALGLQTISALGFALDDFWHVLLPVAYFCFALFAYTFVGGLKSPSNPIDRLLCASIIVLFPYSINLLINKNNVLNFIISYLSITAAIKIFSRSKTKSSIFICSVFILLSAASYQTTIYYFIVFVCAFCIWNGENSKDVWRIASAGCIATLLGLIAYFSTFQLLAGPLVSMLAERGDSQLLIHYGSERSDTNDLAGLMDAGLIYVMSILRVLVAPEPILGTQTKLLALMVFVLAFLRWSRVTRDVRAESDRDRQRYGQTGLFVLVLIGLLGSPIHLLIDDDWIAPRVLAHASAFWAILFLLAFSFTPGVFQKIVRICVIGFVLWIGANTSITVDRAIDLYRADLSLASDIAADLATSEKFDPSKPISVVGLVNRDSPYKSVKSIRYYDLHVSNFASEWSKEAILEEALNFKIKHASPIQQIRDEERCRQLRPFPGLFLTSVSSAGAIVCLVDLRDRAEIQSP